MLNTSLEFKLGQKLTMTPALQQAIKLLQLSKTQLELEIQNLLDSNIMLERDETVTDVEHDFDKKEITEDSVSTIDNIDNASLAEDYNWEDVFTGNSPTQASNTTSTSLDGDYDAIANLSEPSPSLQTHLLEQLNLSLISPSDKALAVFVINHIDERGYIAETTTQLISASKKLSSDNDEIDEAEIELAIHQVQQLEPTGVGARNLAECLCLQLKSSPFDTSLAEQLLSEHQSLLENSNVAGIAKACGRTEAEISTALTTIRQLNPAPGYEFSNDNSGYIEPEVTIKQRHGIWFAELNGDIFSRLRINEQYAQLASNKGCDEMLKQHLQEARWFVKNLHSRNDTLLSVANCITSRQQDYFNQGDIGLKPMVLKDIANDLNLHESTISRVTSHKYMLTPSGPLPFKHFFSSHVGTSDGGEASATAIQAMLRKILSEEPARKPYSDSVLVKKFAEREINIARRTIAKYREAIGIPPSHARKRLED